MRAFALALEITVILALTIAPAAAQSGLSMCFRPDEPALVPPFSADDWEATMDEVEAYLRDMDVYLDCVAREHASALAERNGVVDRVQPDGRIRAGAEPLTGVRQMLDPLAVGH